MNGNDALSKLLHEDRPFLRPIVFVRSVQTPFLFQVEEDILKPVIEEIGDDVQSHMPTADRVARVFSGDLFDDLEELEEIDFHDLDKLNDVPEVSQSFPTTERFTGNIIQPPVLTTHVVPSQDATKCDAAAPQSITDMLTNFSIDPAPALTITESVLVNQAGGGIEDEEEDIIVYAAPHPRHGQSSLPEGRVTNVAAETPSFDSISFNFSPSPQKQQRREPPIFTAHAKSKAKIMTRRRDAFKSQKNRAGIFGTFAMFAANMAEAQLLDKTDPRRRLDDSDIDWADGSSDTSAVNDGVAEGMDLDPELELDVKALKGFVQGMSQAGHNFKTLDDVANEQKLLDEDQDDKLCSPEDSDDENIDLAFNAQEKVLIGEGSSDEDDSSEFEERLQRYRHAARAMQNSKPDDHPYDDFDFVQDMLKKYADSLQDDSKKNQFYDDIEDEEFWTTPRRRKDKGKGLPASLEAVWERDRQKKARRKMERRMEQLQQAADPFAEHRGGKKGRKVAKAAAKLDPAITVLPNRVIDMATLVQRIRRFINDLGGPNSIALPPTNKETRAQIHELANAFQLKSVSKGKGDSRFTTLIKTSRTGLAVNEKKIGRIIRRNGGDFIDRKPHGPRYKEGEEVGKAASKIGESNIGFQLLSLMGWSEGDHIGLSGGIQDPLTAIIKHTKLGLGASRS